jgi:hypothetical protein
MWVSCRMIAACALFLIASVSTSIASQSRDLCETQWKEYVKIASSFHEKVKDTQSSIYIFSTKHGIIFNCLDTGISEDFWEETRDFMQQYQRGERMTHMTRLFSFCGKELLPPWSG